MEAFPAISPGTPEFAKGNVRVTATARLHFGFLDPSGRGPRPFGSFGLSLDQPQTRLVLKRAPKLQVSGTERERGENYLKSIAANCGTTQAYSLHIEDAIPPHAGLGSGTQLALAIGTAFSALEGLDLTPQEIAKLLSRGGRSGIGIGTFEHGGAVLDTGPHEDALPQIAARVPFPDSWRAILIFDPDTRGLTGASETAAFGALPDFPAREADDLYRRVTQNALPALAARDFAAFCAEVGHLQTVMGAYFAPLQGGPYVSADVSAALSWLSGQGMTGLGQSSWGPTGFAFADSQEQGEALLAGLRSRAKTQRLRFTLARGRNEGAVIEKNPQEIR
jgi:beta-ribofuranosylaminobenzene 5'-phosphate synthase